MTEAIEVDSVDFIVYRPDGSQLRQQLFVIPAGSGIKDVEPVARQITAFAPEDVADAIKVILSHPEIFGLTEDDITDGGLPPLGMRVELLNLALALAAATMTDRVNRPFSVLGTSTTAT